MSRRTLLATVSRLLVGVAVLYVLFSLASLLLILAVGRGWLGLEPDPFVAIYAVAFALPWVLIIPEITILQDYAGIAAIVLGMLVNLALLVGIARLLGRRSAALSPMTRLHV